MANDVAELASIFGYELPAEEPEVQEPEAEAVVEEKPSGEGKDQPSPVATGKESTGEAATEPETEIGENESRDERYDELMGRLKRYERFAPIIEMLEEEPKLSRQILAQRMGLTPEVEERGEPAPKEASAEEKARLVQYWQDRMQKDPLAGLAEFIQAVVRDSVAPVKAGGIRAAVREFKAGRQSDPLFKHYESVFDMLVQKSRPEDLENENSLEALDVLAFGAWAKNQRAAAVKANAGRTSTPQEKPRTLASTRSAPAAGGATPRKTRSPEETYLADKYGEEGLDEDEPETAWGS